MKIAKRLFPWLLCLSCTIGLTSAQANDAINVDAEYSAFKSKAENIDSKPLKLALRAYRHAQQLGIEKKPYLTVIDYSRASNQKRMWVLDMKNHTVPFYTYVAHAKNSGVLVPTHFSNTPQSKETSIGAFLTAYTYMGGKGPAMRLEGLEKNVNDNAMRRAIVIHGAWYMNEDFIKKQGRGGLSWACPAVGTNVIKPLINTIKGGSLVFAYYPDSQYLNHSSYVG